VTTRAELRLAHDWYDAPLPAGVEVGPRSWIYSSFAFIHHRSRRPSSVRIGADCGVYNGTMFELGPGGEVEIGDFCTLAGPKLVTNGRIEMGDNCLLSYGVVIADSPYATPASSGGATTVIGSNVWFGARAIAVGGVRIGADAVVGARAVVTGDVPAGVVVAGNPARIVGSAR
jgi:acetyltransferase-like isoleucine patch superfamily enzyme